jgi:NADH-dependent peroxiredoxin subunit F
LNLDKLFIEIGGVPGTALVIPLGVKMDLGGYIEVNSKLETTTPGIFAAGDMVSYGLSIEQIASAVGLGARAAASAFTYLRDDKASPPSVWGAAQINR